MSHLARMQTSTRVLVCQMTYHYHKSIFISIFFFFHCKHVVSTEVSLPLMVQGTDVTYSSSIVMFSIYVRRVKFVVRN